MSLSAFFLHHKKIKSSILPPKINIWFSNAMPQTKLAAIFAMYSGRGDIRKQDFIACFLYAPPLRYKPRIKQPKHMRTTMVNAGSMNPHSKYEPDTMVRTFLTLRHPLAPSSQGALTLRSPGNHFVPTESPISTRTRQVSISPKTYAWGRKTGPFFVLPTLVSRVLHHYWR